MMGACNAPVSHEVTEVVVEKLATNDNGEDKDQMANAE